MIEARCRAGTARPRRWCARSTPRYSTPSRSTTDFRHRAVSGETRNGGPTSEFQVTTPIVGTVNLQNAKDINGVSLANPDHHQTAGVRSRSANVLLTSFGLPGFDGFAPSGPTSRSPMPPGPQAIDSTRMAPPLDRVRARHHEHRAVLVADDRPVKHQHDAARRNIAAFTNAQTSMLPPYLTVAKTRLRPSMRQSYHQIRALPLGQSVASTPAFMNPPSLDPPPDATYPGVRRREQGPPDHDLGRHQRGIFKRIDARLGVEVWGFIPINLLPKLQTLRDGQPVGLHYFVDGSPKIADMQVDGEWHTYLTVGKGRAALSTRRSTSRSTTWWRGRDADRRQHRSNVLTLLL